MEYNARPMPTFLFSCRDSRRALLGVWLALAVALLAPVPKVHAGPGDAGADSVYLVGEFVDPVCIFQHGMQGTLQKQCALVRGRVEQGMFFLDVRQRKLYAVIGQNHWEDPRQGFLEALGDTFAVRGKVWDWQGSKAIAISAIHPWRAQPQPVYRWWPWHWEWSVLLGCALLALLYALAWRRWAPAHEPRSGALVASFAGALAIVLVSLEGPLHDLSDLYLFSAHMVQHLFLAQLFPLLLLLGIPSWMKRALLRPRAVAAVWHTLAGVPAGFILYTLVFSVWHVPALYNLMMRDHGFHILMHLMVMGTAVLMWWPILGGPAVARPSRPDTGSGRPSRCRLR
jgi:hypothetical protein